MPTEITALPTPPSRQDPDNFAARGDAFMSALPDFVTEANALATELNGLVTNFGYAATSVTSNTVDTSGPKTFVVQTELSYQAGQFILIASTASPENYIVGQISSYDAETGELVVSADKAAGSGTFADWSLSLTLSAADEAFIATEADRAEAGADLAESYASAAAASGEVYASTADALSKGVYSLDSLVVGSGGTDGTFALAFSGGAGSGAAGWFTVVSGAISAYEITARGRGYTSAPTVSFAASAGLSGASATAVIALNRDVGRYFFVPASTDESFRDEYLVESGPVATATGRSLPSGESVQVVGARVRNHDADLSEMRGNDQVSADFDWAVIDEDGSVAFGVRPDGSVFVNLSDEDQRSIVAVDNVGADFESDYIYALVDEENKIAFAITRSGELVGRFSAGQNPGAAIDANSVTGPGNTFMARSVGSNIIEFLADGEGATRAYLQRTDIASLTAMFSALGPIEYIPASGQSLSVGGGGDQNPVGEEIFTETPPFANHAFMFNTGTRGVTSSNLDPATLTDFVPAYEQFNGAQGETQGSGMMRALHQLNVSGQDRFRTYVYRTHGAGGQTIAQLSKGSGTHMFNNGVEELQKAVEIAGHYGRELYVRAFTWTQGEADRSAGTTRTEYYDALDQLITDYRTDYAAELPAGNPEIVCIIDQLCAFTSGVGSDVSLAQLDIENDLAYAYISTPKYFMPFVDSVHLLPKWYAILGEYQARVWRTLFVDESDWQPVKPISISRTANVIDVQFSVPKPPLVFDTAALTAATNNGFAFTDGSGSTPTITNTEIIGDDIVRITLSTTPAGPNMALSYAFDGPGASGRSGAWGNLHDSETAVSINDPAITLYNWSLIFKETIS